MATKKISELTNVTSVQDTDLLIVETSEGTRAVKKSNLISRVKTSFVNLSASYWSGDGTTFAQTFAFSGTGNVINNKVDLQPDSEILNQLINDGVSALYIENASGVFTAYAIGAAPTVDLTIQVTITEVE